MAKFFLLVDLSGLKKRDLKHKCAVTNVNWNNLTFEIKDMYLLHFKEIINKSHKEAKPNN